MGSDIAHTKSANSCNGALSDSRFTLRLRLIGLYKSDNFSDYAVPYKRGQLVWPFLYVFPVDETYDAKRELG